MESPFVLLEIKNSRDSEEPVSSMEQVFAAMGSGKPSGLLARLFGSKHSPKWLSFEMVSVNAGVHFFLSTPEELRGYIESQLTAQYPKVLLSPVADYTPHFLSLPHAAGQLSLASPYYLPLKTHKDVRDLDLLASVLGTMAKLPTGEAMAIQMWVSPAGTNWQKTAAGVVARGIPDPTSTTGRTKSHPQARLIEAKISQVGFVAAIRLVAVAANEKRAGELLSTVAGAYGVFGLGEGNRLALSQPAF
ncbi:MAG: hypothetical protein AAB538_05515, partial [Patescibacteria group bacterium]